MSYALVDYFMRPLPTHFASALDNFSTSLTFLSHNSSRIFLKVTSEQPDNSGKNKSTSCPQFIAVDNYWMYVRKTKLAWNNEWLLQALIFYKNPYIYIIIRDYTRCCFYFRTIINYTLNVLY